MGKYQRSRVVTRAPEGRARCSEEAFWMRGSAGKAVGQGPDFGSGQTDRRPIPRLSRDRTPTAYPFMSFACS